MDPTTTERRLHLTFEISILLKGIHAFIEIIGGLVIFFTPKSTIMSLVNVLTREELGEDPKDILMHFLVKTATELSVSGQHFVSFYLLSHGIVKLIIVIALFRKKAWAFPGSLVVFTFFIIYQTYRYTFTHSPWLLLFTLFDVIIILLIINEYNSKKRVENAS